jgi:GT2 family glycosyltransferase
VTVAANSPTSNDTPAPRLGLVVVNYGSHQLIEDNYGWLSTATGVVVVVVDNFKSSVDRQIIGRTTERLGFILVGLDHNRGYGAAANAGLITAERLGCDVIVIANPDISADAPTLEIISRACRSRPGTVISPLVVDDHGRHWGGRGSIDMATGRLWTRDDGAGASWVSGACVAAHVSTWEALGGFDDDYFMYWEDVDLSFRAAMVADGVDVLDTAEVTHAVGGTQDQTEGKSPLYVRHNCRGRLVFAGKHLTPIGRLRWLLGTPADVRRVLSRGERPTRARKLRLLVPAVGGCLSALPWLIAPELTRRISARRRSQPSLPPV